MAPSMRYLVVRALLFLVPFTVLMIAAVPWWLSLLVSLAFAFAASIVFFGPVAVMGTVYAMIGRVTADSIALGVAIGCISAALMLCNNLRDLETDRAAGKRSLSTLIGRRASKALYVVLMLVPFVILWVFSYALVFGIAVFAVLLLAGPAMVIVVMARTPRDLITALGLTGMTALLYGVGLAIAIWGGPAGFVSAT